jgi:hypothetical protein
MTLSDFCMYSPGGILTENDSELKLDAPNYSKFGQDSFFYADPHGLMLSGASSFLIQV